MNPMSFATDGGYADPMHFTGVFYEIMHEDGTAVWRLSVFLR